MTQRSTTTWVSTSALSGTFQQRIKYCKKWPSSAGCSNLSFGATARPLLDRLHTTAPSAKVATLRLLFFLVHSIIKVQQVFFFRHVGQSSVDVKAMGSLLPHDDFADWRWSWLSFLSSLHGLDDWRWGLFLRRLRWSPSQLAFTSRHPRRCWASVVFLPLNLAVGFFGMNTGGLPFTQGSSGTLNAVLLLGSLILITSALFYLWRSRVEKS